MADFRRYLLPSERPVIQVRRHWAVLSWDTIQALGLLVAGIFVDRVAGDIQFVHMLAIYFIVFVIVQWMWKIFDWYVERFVVTDKRVLLVTGIIARKVAIMPLVKVTDLTFNRSAMGLMLGYGEFVVESAGQDQALSKISFIPKPEKLYIQMSELLFGGDKGSAGALPSPGEREAEMSAGRRALRQRRRPWTGFRRRRGPVQPTPVNPERLGGVNDMLDQRDNVLLAEREYRRRPDPRLVDSVEDPTSELPRIHDPRRDRNDDEFYEPPSRPPPPRWAADDPPHAPPIDPADD